MPRFKMIAMSKPMPGRDAEYHDWYQNTHLPQVCAFPGVLGAQRYVEAAALAGGDDRKFMAIYDIETDDLGAVLGAIGKASADGTLTPTPDAVDAAGMYCVVFTELGERVNG